MRGTDRAIKQVRKAMELGISRLGGMHASVSVHTFGLGLGACRNALLQVQTQKQFLAKLPI